MPHFIGEKYLTEEDWPKFLFNIQSDRNVGIPVIPIIRILIEYWNVIKFLFFIPRYLLVLLFLKTVLKFQI